MFGYQVDVERPLYLLVLLAVPAMWYWGRHSLAALGSGQRIFAFWLRAAVIAGIALALAEVHVVRTDDRLAVIYVLDRSLSVSAEQASAAITFINKTRVRYRNRQRSDLAGVIVFGSEAAVELPPVDDDVPILNVESRVENEATDLAAALRLARACFPPGCAKRIVVLSDGNENLGTAAEEARALAAADVGIDVVPLRHPNRGDVAVDKVAVPGEVRRRMPFEIRVVLNNRGTAPGGSRPTIAGRLRVFRTAGPQEQLVTEQSIEVKPGKQVFALQEELEASDFYTYDAEFLPDNPQQDAVVQNNRASAYTQVHGQGRALLIEDWSNPGEFAGLIERLREAHIEVDVQPSNQLFANLAELQRYDTVVLANVPRTSGEASEDLSQFSDDQIGALVRNTQQLGGGLVMLGGPNSFGAGGWTNTELERAMPVDFQIKNAKVVPVGALVLVLDKSGSMQGEKVDMSKAAAIAALKTLGARDHLGVVAFDGAAHWIARMQRVGTGNRIAAQVSRLGADGGTQMLPGMAEGYRALERVEAAVKHMIVLTDGRTEGTGFEALSARMRDAGITTTCVAIGADADARLMQAVARAGGGKFYRVVQPKTIPRIFMKEARRVARPLVYETENPFSPNVEQHHEMLEGIGGPLPPLTGFVMTTPKQNALVEIPLSSPRPAPGAHPLLAAWTYGLGRAVALTTDAGARWTTSWPDWQGYDKLFAQIVRWSMRPTTGDGRLTLFAEARDGRLRAIVTALDKDDQYLNFLGMHGSVVGAASEPVSLVFAQFAPGRYVADCPLVESGNYFVTVVPGDGLAPVRAGVQLAHSVEFRDTETNLALLNDLAGQAPPGGPAGRVINAIDPDNDASTESNVFRHDLPPAVARLPYWHLAAMAAACLFLVDVFNRRVVVPVGAVAQWAAGLARRTSEPAVAPDTIARLRGNKQQIVQRLDDRRAAARFETPDDALPSRADEMKIEDPKQATIDDLASTITPGKDDESSYTARLLQAKRSVHRDRQLPPDAVN